MIEKLNKEREIENKKLLEEANKKKIEIINEQASESSSVLSYMKSNPSIDNLLSPPKVKF